MKLVGQVPLRRSCLWRFKLHRWEYTTGFSFAYPRGYVIRCTECKRLTTTTSQPRYVKDKR